MKRRLIIFYVLLGIVFSFPGNAVLGAENIPSLKENISNSLSDTAKISLLNKFQAVISL